MKPPREEACRKPGTLLVRRSVSRKHRFCKKVRAASLVTDAKNDLAEALVRFHPFVSAADVPQVEAAINDRVQGPTGKERNHLRSKTTGGSNFFFQRSGAQYRTYESCAFAQSYRGIQFNLWSSHGADQHNASAMRERMQARVGIGSSD